MQLLLAAALFYLGSSQYNSNECSVECNKVKLDVLTLSMCRQAKKTLPKPKVGEYCTVAMEQGFSDACWALCMSETPVNRVAQACRAASMEMPRPTVRKWCEHGYSKAFDQTSIQLKSHFAQISETGEADVEPEVHAAPIISTIPISLDNQMLNLEIHENESAEDALVVFCNQHAADDTSGCIRNLLPVVLERLEEHNA